MRELINKIQVLTHAVNNFNPSLTVDLTGPITALDGVTSIGSQTGTGSTFAMSASPTFTGTPLAPTAAGGTNTTQIATTAYVTAAIAASPSLFTDAGAYTYLTSTTDLFQVGSTASLGASLGVKGQGATSGTFTAKFSNSSGALSLQVRDDGSVYNIGKAGTSGCLAFGELALLNNTGNNNTALGSSALVSNTIGYGNVAIGIQAMSLANGANSYYNVGIGLNALYANEGFYNVSVGAQSLRFNTSGSNNVAIGEEAIYNKTTGNTNVGIGYQVLFTSGSGGTNTAVGAQALYDNSTGSGNVALGFKAGRRELGSNKFYVANEDFATEALGRTGSIIYGIMDATVTSQVLNFNAKVAVNGRLLKQQGTDVASVAGAIALALDGNVFEVTGTNAITLISNVGWQNGAEVTLLFTSTATLTNGTATSGTDITIKLAGAANFVASADDSITLTLCEIGGAQAWREKCRSIN